MRFHPEGKRDPIQGAKTNDGGKRESERKDQGSGEDKNDNKEEMLIVFYVVNII